MTGFYGTSLQDALLKCTVVTERRFTGAGPGDWYFLRLDDVLIPLGDDKHFADMFQFALRRNAEAFDRPSVSLVAPEGNEHD